MVFALFGLQIFMGVLRQKCVATVPAYNGTPSYTYAQYYNDFIKNSSKYNRPQDKSAYLKIIFLFVNQNICCGYSKEPSRWDGSFEHPKHMF